MMSALLLAATLFLVVAGLQLLFRLTHPKTERQEPWPFYARPPLTRPEQVLYHRLVQALPDHIVLAQVQLSRLLGVRKGHRRLAWFNRISRMSADFVICTAGCSVVAVVELDDSSHRRPSRMEADAKKEQALASAGIRLIRWDARAIPDAATIRSAIASAGTEPAAA